MTRYGIARFVGSWVSASGYCLHIKKVRKDQASVDFLDAYLNRYDEAIEEDAKASTIGRGCGLSRD